MTAMTAATLDTLSGGRFRLGLGVSGPQVSEGWHGVRFDDPLGRTREYVDVVRTALARRPVAYQGRHITLPLPDGPGKALRLTVTPVREHVPLYLASLGPRNLRLTGELADGWLGLFVAPDHVGDSLARIEEGRRAAGHDGLAGFDVCATAPLVLTPDGPEAQVVAAAAEPVRGYAALYLGGMGSRSQNFYNALARRMGYEAEAAAVQDLYLDRRPREAAAAVPAEFVDATSLLGPPARVAERMAALADAGVTTLNVVPFAPDLDGRIAMLRGAVDALEASGRAG
jgi:F420-dependent oxidoreductase-like protein